MSASAHRRLHDPRYLQLHVKGNGNVADVSGNGVAATPTSIAYAQGPYNGHQMLSFTSANQVSYAASAGIAATGSMSIALNFRATAGTYREVCNRYGDGSDRVWWLELDNLDSLIFYIANPANPSASSENVNAGTITNGRHYHVAATYGVSGRKAIYLDGKLIAEGAAAYAAQNDSAEPVIIGRRGGALGYVGLAGNFRYYNIALTGDEVAALYEYDTR